MLDKREGPQVFDYLDYRKFLFDFYQYKKHVNRGFSHRLFAHKAGFRSSGYFCDVLRGRRNLSKSYIPKFAMGLGLDASEREYFDLMVKFTHAGSERLKQTLYEMLIKTMPLKIQRLRQFQMEYFSKWYHVAVREALSIRPVGDEVSELAALLHPPITPAQANSALKVLSTLGLAEKDQEGRWRARHVSLLSKGEETSTLLLRSFQGEMIGRAKEALNVFPRQQRDISCVTMSVSPRAMQRIRDMVADFHNRVVEVVQTDENEDRVIQLNIQVFPLTRIEEKNVSHPA